VAAVQRSSRQRARVTRGLLIIAAALCVPLVPFFIIGELPGERWLSAADQHAGLFALTGASLLAIDVLLPVPSSIVGTMLGARLGFLPGFLATFAGLMTGQIGAYAASRWWLARRHATPLPAAPTLTALFLSRPVPVLAEAMALAAGAARLHWGQFLAACGAGNFVYAVALALNGAELVPGAPIGPGLLLPMLLPAAAWLAWQRLRKNHPTGGPSHADLPDQP
jgi:uncharacterized membrane protein YdjX (TVP38/TMEM64 family)